MRVLLFITFKSTENMKGTSW